MSIFRTATKQAILDILGEHATSARFGTVLTEDALDAACERIVDLFETTLELRGRAAATPLGEALGLRGESQPPARTPPHQGAPRTRTPQAGAAQPAKGGLQRNQPPPSRGPALPAAENEQDVDFDARTRPIRTSTLPRFVRQGPSPQAPARADSPASAASTSGAQQTPSNPLEAGLGLQLPRRRVSIAPDERERLTRSR